MSQNNIGPYRDIYGEIKETLLQARSRVYAVANSTMVEAYWQIGRIIVEHEQGGNARAEYGKGLIPLLAKRLTEDFGKGFNEQNLRNMRQFYETFPIHHALRSELNWTHYRLLMRVENKAARELPCLLTYRPLSALQRKLNSL